jgi:CP family cyanate transporter-like MFS transporter
MSEAKSSPSPPRSLRWVLLLGVWTLYGTFGLVATSLAPLVVEVEADLGMSHVAMGTVMGAWQLVYILAAIPCGILLDRLGVRSSLLIGALLVGASAFGRSIADGYIELLLAVMVFGLGGPIISAGAPKVITQWFKGSQRGLAMGIYMTGPAVGGIVSLTLTHSMLLPWFEGDWRRVFALWAAFTVAAGALWWLIAGHPAALRVEREESQAPRLPRREVLGTLLRDPAVRLVLLMGVGVFLFNHGLVNWLPELLRSGGMGVVEAGYWAAIPTVIGIAGSLLIPRLATPARRHRILIALCLAAGGASLLLQFQEPPVLFTGLLLQGIARSSLMTVLILTLIELPGIGERSAGTASGLFFSAAEVGGVLGPIGLGVLYDLTGTFESGLYALTLIALGVAFCAVRLRKSE